MRNSTDRSSPADVITAAIIERLEAGVQPWVRPWKILGGPRRATGETYRGINYLYLGLLAELRGYASPYWLTYRQAQADGGQVRRGERGSIAVFYTSYSKRADGTASNNTQDDGRKAQDETRRVLKAYSVFSADQCDGLPAKYHPAADQPLAALPASARHDDIEKFLDCIPAVVQHGGDQAYYNVDRDYIQLPLRQQFKSDDFYLTTRIHETLHNAVIRIMPHGLR